MLDCFRSEIISLAMDTNIKKELCIKAISDAYTLRKPGDGVIIHSDAGSQYTSRKYKKTLGGFHAIQSMRDTAKCYYNAKMESWKFSRPFVLRPIKPEKRKSRNQSRLIHRLFISGFRFGKAPNVVSVTAPME